jgi:hypothetical protein
MTFRRIKSASLIHSSFHHLIVGCGHIRDHFLVAVNKSESTAQWAIHLTKQDPFHALLYSSISPLIRDPTFANLCRSFNDASTALITGNTNVRLVWCRIHNFLLNWFAFPFVFGDWDSPITLPSLPLDDSPLSAFADAFYRAPSLLSQLDSNPLTSSLCILDRFSITGLVTRFLFAGFESRLVPLLPLSHFGITVCLPFAPSIRE